MASNSEHSLPAAAPQPPKREFLSGRITEMPYISAEMIGKLQEEQLHWLVEMLAQEVSDFNKTKKSLHHYLAAFMHHERALCAERSYSQSLNFTIQGLRAELEAEKLKHLPVEENQYFNDFDVGFTLDTPTTHEPLMAEANVAEAEVKSPDSISNKELGALLAVDAAILGLSTPPNEDWSSEPATHKEKDKIQGVRSGQKKRKFDAIDMNEPNKRLKQ
ncbi:uncharacterized protein PAC_05608 [Phialocephala subalpina]|uniref:Uncharacterized protein n=1 Tax=Phialocephala subalpina TaxID=576137 RepID=A0A1L7WSG7_9HELO|nr:uncharacterized protein PAC_05608 [Phialocephala subalpina]